MKINQFKIPIIVLIVIALFYFLSSYVDFSDDKKTLEDWTNLFSSFIDKPPVEPRELTLLRKLSPGCRLGVTNETPFVLIPNNGSCLLLLASSKELVRTLFVNSKEGIKINFVGEKGGNGEPAPEPFKNMDLDDLVMPLNILVGGGKLTLRCKNRNGRQCKVILGHI